MTHTYKTPIDMESRPAPLHSQRVCRFCLTESEPLKYIYEPDHNNPSQVPLTVQINSCVGIEVSEADGMPQMICLMCHWNLDRFHKFRLQCKRADEALRYYPLSGVLPRPFPPISINPPELSSKKPAETGQQHKSTKKLRTDNTERDRCVTRERKREREKERERDRDRVNENQLDKSSNNFYEQFHDFYEEEQDGVSEGEETKNIERVKEDSMKLEPGEIRVHACDQCERTFPLRQALSLHVQTAHRERNHKCTECERMFFSKYDLSKHMNTHSKEKPFACQICQKQFSRQNLLLRHEKVHRDEMRYGCPHCEREFFTTEDLEKHEDAAHRKDKPFQCNICNKRFQYKQGLERHETLHSEDKTFVCEYCKEAFHTSTKLARHLSTHAGHRPYMCKLCPRTFLLSHHLTRHMRTHSVEKCHVYEDCGKAFKRKESLEVHQLTHTKRTRMGLMCDVCQESCHSRADYVTHIKQHIEAGEKMGLDGLKADNKSKLEMDWEEEEEEEDQYSNGDDDYKPPAYIIKKLPKSTPRRDDSNEKGDEEKGQQCKEQVVFVRKRDGNMMKKTIKTLMPIQQREMQEQKSAAKQSGSSTFQNDTKNLSAQSKEENSTSAHQNDTEAPMQKIVASVEEHKIPLKYENVAVQEQSNEESSATMTSSAIIASHEACKADVKTEMSTTEIVATGTGVMTFISILAELIASEFSRGSARSHASVDESKRGDRRKARRGEEKRGVEWKGRERSHSATHAYRTPADMESRPAPLRSRRVCRFCLTESEPLNYIYERDHNKPFQVPLTLQIMSCVAIEVYAADGMPQMICSMCRWNLDRSYKFKLQCKKADEALRDYPLSGVLPRPFPPIPNDPPEVNMKRPAEARQQHENTKKPRTDNTERERRVTRERERERERDRDRANEKQRDKSSNEQRHDFYEEEQEDGGSEGEETKNVERVKEDSMKLEPGEIRVHACDQCERTFPLRQALSLHIQSAHRERNYKCTECERMFFSKYDLSKHLSTHSEEKPFACQICQKQFSRQNLLQRHEKVHRDETRYGCPHCEREFFTTEDLEKHEDAAHKKEKPFQCNICNKRFQYKQGLERHETLHNEDKTFVCEYCKEAFHTSTKLARHLSSHAGHRPYMCKLCPRTFLLSHHLTRHMRTHSVEKRHVCEDCGKAFKRKESLEVHQLTHTKRTGMGLTCDVCQESCRNRADYVTHIKQHIEAGEKMGPDGLQPDNKARPEADSEEEEEEEDQYSDGDDDYEPPAYIIKKMPKPSPRKEDSDEEEDEEEGQQRKEQVVFVRGKDGNMVKKTIKTLMPIQRREMHEQKSTAKQSGSSTSQSGTKNSSAQSKEENPKGTRLDDTEAQVQKIVASVFKEHKIPLKHQNAAAQEQSNKESSATVTSSQATTASHEARKADDKTEMGTEIVAMGTGVMTPTSKNVKVIKRFVLRKPGGNIEGTPSNINTNISTQEISSTSVVSNPSSSSSTPIPGTKVNKRLIVRRIIRHGDTTREVVMNPDGTVVDPAELAKLPSGNVVKRVVVKAKGQNLVQALLHRVEHQKAGETILDDTMTNKFELKTSPSSSNGNSSVVTIAASATSTPKNTITSPKATNQQQSIVQEDQETKEKLERLEKRVEQQRLKIEELQARKQEYEAIDDMLPERHDESEDEQQLPLKRVFVKRKQSIYDEEQEYNDNDTEMTTAAKPVAKNVTEQSVVNEEDKSIVEETPENIQKEIQNQQKEMKAAASSNATTSTLKKGPIISSDKVYTNRRFLIMKPEQSNEVEEMSRELCNILETTDSVAKMQETVLSNLTQISSTETTLSLKAKSGNDSSAVETVEQQVEAMEIDCESEQTIKQETMMEVEIASQQTEIKLTSSAGEAEDVRQEEEELSQDEDDTTPHLVLDTPDLPESADIFEPSDDVLDVQKSTTLNESVIELSQSNETINLNDTNDSQDSLEDKLSQMEG
ncbi:uncharacterized protein LOC116847199 [Odontomachus brunneus]|uniref:uncharacterized protein LOC116847199 n=1 Tax=Odontomachus brunneus TaxID=486640 RepID=UPI0013F25C0D|nr:uncharacterized protein LOC116847199 [Odontomachus brunneus]